MDSQPPLNNAETRGYLSQEDKRKFTIRAGILGAVFFLAQFIVPFAVMIAIMPLFVFSVFEMRMADPERGTYFDGAIWYVEKGIDVADNVKNPPKLKKIDLDDMDIPKDVEELNIEKPWLLGGEDRLWIINSSNIGWYGKDGLVLSDGMQLGDICKPFLYEGKPAVVQSRPEGLSLLVWNEQQWQKICPIDLNTKERVNELHKNLQVLSEKNVLHFFIHYGDNLYYKTGRVNDMLQAGEEWQVICECSGKWQTAWIDNTPAVFYLGSRDYERCVLGLKFSENQWNQFYSYNISMVEGIGIYPLPQTDKFAMLFQSFPGSMRLLMVKGATVTEKKRYGSDFPFPRSLFLVMFIPHGMMMLMPLILAIILSGMMRKYRKCEHEVSGLSMPFASLARRAVAQMIDFLFIVGPGAIGYFLAMLPVFNMENMSSTTFISVFIGFGLVIAGILWMFVCLFLFSYLEGRWGVTPGKWLLRIRVIGVDMKRCGFGRALIRNLLKFVDGFFNFMVGVMVAALTENWQRVGDMAARTIVIYTGKKNEQVQESPFSKTM
jgi:uncharacterized RDD family membrane protein YckC